MILDANFIKNRFKMKSTWEIYGFRAKTRRNFEKKKRMPMLMLICCERKNIVRLLKSTAEVVQANRRMFFLKSVITQIFFLCKIGKGQGPLCKNKYLLSRDPLPTGSC
jgi:hypothetical protein